ncbi:MAG: phage virion morphogenesis protein [Devosia sp.]
MPAYLEILNEAEVEAFFAKAAILPPRLAKMIGLQVENQTRDRFNTKEGPDGPWAAWKPSTAKSKKAGFSLMVDSGRLAQSIQSSVSGLEAKVGTNVHYARYHQEGTRHMVARPIVGLSDANKRDLEDRVKSYVARALR